MGGADVDRKFTLDAAVPSGVTSLCGRAVTRFGGVARNVAHNLVRLGVATSLISLTGDDDDGRALLRELERDGVDVRGVCRIAGAATAQYVAVIDPHGALVLEIADMSIFERFAPDDLARTWPSIATADWIVADTNLRADVIEALAQRRCGAGYRLALDAVSLPKAASLPARLDGVDVLFLNEAEAAAYLAAHGTVPDGPAALALAVRARGAGAVVLTRGAADVLVARDGIEAIPAFPARSVVDVTGAGDALLAATIARLLAGDDLVAAVRSGARAAALTIETDATVRADLSPALVAP
ncbi:MAG: carbohydrate kinase [Candidatus Eremiobacteraeota bacterium]|nr:carbohydrate kinase [Candidatus Eremiobacteraeota bacterium]